MEWCRKTVAFWCVTDKSVKLERTIPSGMA